MSGPTPTLPDLARAVREARAEADPVREAIHKSFVAIQSPHHGTGFRGALQVEEERLAIETGKRDRAAAKVAEIESKLPAMRERLAAAESEHAELTAKLRPLADAEAAALEAFEAAEAADAKAIADLRAEIDAARRPHG